jgi:hypothetical protein
VYSDDHNLFMSYSTNGGSTWSKAVKVNKVATALMPWAVALAPGKLDIVFYGSSFFKAGVTPDSYPSTAPWKVYFAQNTNVLHGGGFSQVAATPINHFGGVCEGGISCTGNRDLYDDFGVAVSPTTGLASIVFSDDQFINDANNPPAPGCGAAQSNTGACDHTAIATQTGGTAIK